MHVLLVAAPPSPVSLAARLVDAADDELRRSGHTTTVVDVVASAWHPIVRPHDYGVDAMVRPVGDHAVEAIASGRLAADVAEQQRHVREADAIVLLFPLWWFGMPAALKGWVDRVFTQGFAYGVKDAQGRTRKYGDGAFAGTRGLVVVTTGDRATAFGPRGLNGSIDDVLFPITHGILWYTGVASLEPLTLLGVDTPGWAGGDDAEAQVRARMRTLATDEPIAFRRMLDDYDDERVLLPEHAVGRDDLAIHRRDR